MGNDELVWHTPAGKGWTFDLLAESLLELGVRPRAVLHVGAHLGEEVPYYRAAGFERIVLVEPDPVSAAVLREKFGVDSDVELHELACGTAAVHPVLHRNELSFFSGLLPRRRGKARTVETRPVTVKRVDELQAGENVLVIDTQGTEMDALRSASLSGVDLVIVEAWEQSNRPEVECAAPLHMLDRYMARHGFERAIRWVYDESGYFDVLYVLEGSR